MKRLKKKMFLRLKNGKTGITLFFLVLTILIYFYFRSIDNIADGILTNAAIGSTLFSLKANKLSNEMVHRQQQNFVLERKGEEINDIRDNIKKRIEEIYRQTLLLINEVAERDVDFFNKLISVNSIVSMKYFLSVKNSIFTKRIDIFGRRIIKLEMDIDLIKHNISEKIELSYRCSNCGKVVKHLKNSIVCKGGIESIQEVIRISVRRLGQSINLDNYTNFFEDPINFMQYVLEQGSNIFLSITIENERKIEINLESCHHCLAKDFLSWGSERKCNIKPNFNDINENLIKRLENSTPKSLKNLKL